MFEIMKKMKCLLIATVLVGMSTVASAQTDCSFSITQFEVGRFTQGATFEVFNSIGLVSDIAIQLTRNGLPGFPSENQSDQTGGNSFSSENVDQETLLVPTEPFNTEVQSCRPELSIRHAGSLFRASEQLYFQLVSQNTIEDMSSRTLILSDSAYSVGEQRLYQIDVRFPAYQFVEAGEYSGDFDVSVVARYAGMQGNVDTLSVDDRASRDLSVKVPSSARLSLAGTQQRRQLVDFGTLEVGKRSEMPVALTVQSTASYQLRIRSENGGQLLRKGDTTADGIPYETTVNNRRIALDNGSEAIISRSRTGESGDSIPLSFRIIDVRGKRAGEYVDKLTISVVPAITEY